MSRTGAEILRPLSKSLLVHTPFAPGNRQALESLGLRVKLDYLGGGKWQLSRRLFRPAVSLLAERFGVVDVYTEHRASQRCDIRCAEATGDDCVCSCLGDNHGGGLAGWRLVAETTLTQGDIVTAHHVVRREDLAAMKAPVSVQADSDHLASLPS